MTLTGLADKAEIQEAMHRLGVTLRRGATQPYLVIEVPGSGGTWDKPEPVIWHQHLELWAFLGIESAETRYWCCFGVVSPAIKPKQTPVVEINSPIEGRNFRAQGAFARDAKGKVYYLHQGSVHGGALTPRITPEPHPRASQSRFVESGLWKGERPVVTWPDGASREMFVLGQLDHESLAPTLAAYVHAALQFRLLMGQRRPVRAKRTVFLSHSNADTDKQWCDEFVSVLRARGREVWYDQLSLMPGVLAEQLTREIAAHDGFVLALSRNALGSPYVRQEIDWALALWREHQQPIIMPIRLDDCEMLVTRPCDRSKRPSGWIRCSVIGNGRHKAAQPCRRCGDRLAVGVARRRGRCGSCWRCRVRGLIAHAGQSFRGTSSRSVALRADWQPV